LSHYVIPHVPEIIILASSLACDSVPYAGILFRARMHQRYGVWELRY